MRFGPVLALLAPTLYLISWQSLQFAETTWLSESQVHKVWQQFAALGQTLAESPCWEVGRTHVGRSRKYLHGYFRLTSPNIAYSPLATLI